MLKTLVLGDGSFDGCSDVILEGGDWVDVLSADLPELVSIDIGSYSCCFYGHEWSSLLVMRSKGV